MALHSLVNFYTLLDATLLPDYLSRTLAGRTLIITLQTIGCLKLLSVILQSPNIIMAQRVNCITKKMSQIILKLTSLIKTM